MRGGELNDRLVEDLRARRSEAIGELLATYGRQIQGVAYLVVGSQEDAEEIVIDTVLGAWQHADQLRAPGALRTWLLRIATRHALSRRRTSHHVDPLFDDVATVPEPGIDRIALLTALDQLAPPIRAAIVLHYFAGLTVEETASALGKSANTVKTQLQGGLRRLRDQLASDDWPAGEPSEADRG